MCKGESSHLQGEKAIRFVVAILSLIVGVTLTLLLLASGFHSASTLNVSERSAAFQDKEVSPPKGWKKIEVEGKVILFIPEEMKSSEVLGDSSSYRDAFSNADLRITIIYGESDSCATPAHLVKRPTYKESVVQIDGRKAKLGIDRYCQPESIIAYLCSQQRDNTTQLRVSAVCKDDRALKTAQQIFTSIRFKQGT